MKNVKTVLLNTHYHETPGGEALLSPCVNAAGSCWSSKPPNSISASAVTVETTLNLGLPASCLLTHSPCHFFS